MNLDQVLGLLYLIVLKAEEAEDFLLLPEGFILRADSIFVNYKTETPRLIYSAEQGVNICFMDYFMALIRSLKSMRHIIGLTEALDRVLEMMRLENPDMHALALIIDSVRREWGIIYTSA